MLLQKTQLIKILIINYLLFELNNFLKAFSNLIFEHFACLLKIKGHYLKSFVSIVDFLLENSVKNNVKEEQQVLKFQNL